MVGGSGSFSSKDQNGIKSSSINLSPNVGYFFLDKLAAGMDVGFYTSKTKFGPTDKSRLTGYGISPFVRYYVLPASNKVNLFAEGSYGWASGKSKTSSGFTNASKSHAYTFSAGPVFFINQNVAIEISAGYTKSNSKQLDYVSSKSEDKSLHVSIGFQIHLGSNTK